MTFARRMFLLAMVFAGFNSNAADLSTRQIEELTVFGLRAMGTRADISDVKKVLTYAEVEKVVRAGLNLQGRLCARITEIQSLQVEMPASYKLTCITHTGGRAKTNYYIEALQGVSYDVHEYSSHLCKVC